MNIDKTINDDQLNNHFNLSESSKSISKMQQQNSTNTNEILKPNRNFSVPVLYLNKNQVLSDTNIKISNEKLDSIEPIDLEANLICSTNSLKSKPHQSVTNKLRNVGKILTDKLSNQKLKNNSPKPEIDVDDDSDEDFNNQYDEQYYKTTDNDFKIASDKINNAILYEENDEEDDDHFRSDLDETNYFLKNTKDLIPIAVHEIPSPSSSIQPNETNFNQTNELKEDFNKTNSLAPVDLNFSSSFISNVSNFSQAKPSVSIAQQPNQVRTLKKAMTQGSKAMRIMGNNDSNGPMNKMVSITDSNNKKSSVANNNMMNNINRDAKKLQQKRLFFKNGNINISRSNIDKRRRRYLTDIFTTLIDLKWRYNLLVFALGFLMSWTAFAMTWYFISYIHGDLEIVNLENKNYTACVAGISTFSGAILFSIETQQTIGYGVRYTTEKCPEAIFVMMVQSSVGVMIQSFMVGVVFAKLSRPKKRSETLMFSKNAVISLRDGRLCLICRVGDMRKSHIVEAHVRMYLIKKKVTQEGEIMPLHMYDLNCGWDKGLDRLFLVWPLTIEHYIDEHSPFWSLSADDLKKERFELAVILEGIVESTGMTTQARSSYLVNEMLWGHRFEKLITFQKEDGTYKIDYSRFNMTVPVDTPTCSAKDLDELKEQEKFYSETFNDNSNSPSTVNSKEMIRAEGIENPSDLRRRKIESKDENQTNIITNEANVVPINSETINCNNICEQSQQIETKI